MSDGLFQSQAHGLVGETELGFLRRGTVAERAVAGIAIATDVTGDALITGLTGEVVIAEADFTTEGTVHTTIDGRFRLDVSGMKVGAASHHGEKQAKSDGKNKQGCKNCLYFHLF